jgi:ribosomal protein L23
LIKDANKYQLNNRRKFIQRKVKSVHTAIFAAKQKEWVLMKVIKDWKKAMVKLQEGQEFRGRRSLRLRKK